MTTTTLFVACAALAGGAYLSALAACHWLLTRRSRPRLAERLAQRARIAKYVGR